MIDSSLSFVSSDSSDNFSILKDSNFYISDPLGVHTLIISWPFYPSRWLLPSYNVVPFFPQAFSLNILEKIICTCFLPSFDVVLFFAKALSLDILDKFSLKSSPEKQGYILALFDHYPVTLLPVVILSNENSSHCLSSRNYKMVGIGYYICLSRDILATYIFL